MKQLKLNEASLLFVELVFAFILKRYTNLLEATDIYFKFGKQQAMWVLG